MTWLAGIIPAILQWLFSGSVQTTVAHSPDTLAKLGLDQKSLTGIPPKLCILFALCLFAGCTAVNIDMGKKQTTITLALAEPSNISTITTDESIPVIATTAAGATQSQVQASYNCKGMVVLPKSVYRALKAKAFPDTGVGTWMPAAVNIPLGGAEMTVGTVIDRKSVV